MLYEIKDIKLFGYHGVNSYEKKHGQYFYIDIFFRLDSANKNNFTDDISDFPNYISICNEVSKSFNNKRYNLIEKIASEIYKTLSRKFELIKDLEVIVKKNDPLKNNEIRQVSFKYKK